MEILAVRQLNFTYAGSDSPALRDVTLSIRKGEFFVLCGDSGSGKSTLLRHLKPALTPHGSRSGEIFFRGAPLASLTAGEASSAIGFVLQSPEAQVVTDKVWHELAFGLESMGLDTPAIRRRTAEMAAFFGMETWYHSDVSQLSGGQKQLLCLASVMAMQPEVLILDEPTAQLDPIAASEFLAALGKIHRELGTTIVLSEHRLEEALALADRAAVMQGGRILCAGTVEEVGRQLKKSGSAMFAAMPTPMRVWGAVESELPCPVTVQEGRAFLQSYTADHEVQPLPPRPVSCGGEERLRVREAWFRYGKEQPDVVRGLDLTARAGELFCILGGNGSGKTTTLRLLAGLKKPYRGTVERQGTVGLLPQDPRTVFVRKTVEEDLAEAVRDLAPEERSRRIADAAVLCRIENLLDRHPYDLSGGEQQRAALCKVLLGAPDILLLDEPTKGLDAPFKKTLAEILARLKNSGIAVVMVSHDIEFCARRADRCGLFFDGSLVTTDTPAAFFAGNSFYTTAANRMAREIEPRAVTAEDVTALLGAAVPEEEPPREKAPDFRWVPPAKRQENRLPLRRRIGAAVCTLGALGVYCYTARTGTLSQFLSSEGVTALGITQLLWYALLIALLAGAAAFLSRRTKQELPPQQISMETRKLSRRTAAASVLLLLLVPVTLLLGAAYLDRRQYYLTALLVLLECMAPFFLRFEGRRPRARELVLIAVLCALAVAGRIVFFMLPQFKPVMALAIVAGVSLGGETGFLVGAVSMLVSNILFSQGPWTPWQMFTMGLVGYLAGVLCRKGWLRRSRGALCIYGVLATFLIYGAILNPSAALIWGSETLNWKIWVSYYITGFPMDAVHAASTALFLWFGAEPLLEQLERVKVKYGLLEADGENL